jgi:hypothetical protein
MAVQIALDDPDVQPPRPFELAMRFAAGQLGFEWKSETAPPAGKGRRSQRRR